MKGTCRFGLFLGRLCIAVIFILSGFSKFVNYDATIQYMAAKGFTMVPAFLVGAAVVEIVGGILLIVGCKVRWGALLLMLYLIPVTYIFHNFWSVPEAEQQAQIIEFLKNLAIFGGLFYVLCVGTGACRSDTICTVKSPEIKP